MPKWLGIVWRVVVLATFVWWSVWRCMLVTGDVHKVGGSCSGLLNCASGPCLIHARDGSGAWVTGPGYCSQGCTSDADCASGMRCEDRPPEISRAGGDHLPFIKVPARLCIKTSAPAHLPATP